MTTIKPIEPALRPAAPLSRRKFLGEILVAQGIISQQQLSDVLIHQKSNKSVRIGRLLVELGYVTEIVLADCVADQLRLPSADLSTLTISPDALQRVPRELALRHQVLPWMVDGRDLYIITADPTALAGLDAIGFKTGMRVKPVVAPESQVHAALARHYGVVDEVGMVGTPESINLAHQLAIVDEEDAATKATEDELERAAQAGPVIKLVNSIIADAIRIGASDIHIEPQQKGVNLRYRVDGALRHIITMPKRSQAKIVSRIKITAHMDISERRKPQDGRTRIVLNGSAFDLRVSTLPTADGEKVVIRLLSQDRPTIPFEELGFEPDTLEEFKGLLRRPQGLVLVTGPTGSGKTSTLYAALNFLTDTASNIVTIEDPIEYRLPGINQVAVSERSGLSFSVGLRSILRQDPNVVMVGEIRDKETAQVAFQAAQTGHLVLSTLHTNDAPSSVTRLVEIGIPAYVVASSLIGVVAQRLVRRVCSCRTSRHGSQASVGCEMCASSGFKGRIAVHELLKVTPRVRTALLGHANGDLLRETACSSGMRSMFADGELKVSRGVTTTEELMRVVPPREIDDSVVPHDVVKEPGQRHLVMVSSPKPARLRLPRILVVDGDVTWTERISSVLATESYDVLTANSAGDVHAAVQRDQPELIVMELRGMPGLAGLDFLRKLRSNMSTYRTGVIFLTNVDDPEAEVRALDAGADDYLRAPVNPALLLGRIRRALLRTHLLANAG